MKNIDYKYWAEKIRNYYQSTGCILDDKIKAKVVAANPDEKSISMEITANEYSLNSLKIMHGGVISWVFDLAMAVAISTYGGESLGTTADMSVDFLRPIPFGTKLIVKAYAVNLGGFLRRARAEFYIGNDIVAYACGNYTGKKMLGEFRLGYIDPKTSKVEDDFVRYFILEGEKKALVIDSGVSGAMDTKELAEKLSGLPSVLINTHADPDHIAGNKYFSTCLMHKTEKKLYEMKCKEVFGEEAVAKARFIKDGDVIDLGNRPLEVIHIPGHTAGSIALLDIKNRVLYAGDSVQSGEIYMFGEHRNMEAYIASLEKLNSMKNRFDIIRASHDEMDHKPAIIGKLIKAAKAVQSGKATGELRTLYGKTIIAYDMGCATFLCGESPMS